ncbi:MAG: alpha/beta fold hydrolase [Trueperaceae bacterium]|nr:alpha/beta fold hydrolase [Trueperaceae bacterium]
MNGIDLRPTRPGADPHAHAPILSWGPAPGEAPVAIVLLHGRGDSAAGILGLAPELDARGTGPVTVLAPDAVGAQWYPLRFLEPVERNEPWLTSALAVVERTVAELEAAGVPRERIVVAGFSQGACLALEYVARAGGAWGGAVALSGGLIGAEVDPARYPERLDGTPVFLGCSDVDAHIPEGRVHASGRQLLAQGASVTSRIYPGMPHTVNADELAWFADHVRGLAGRVS